MKKILSIILCIALLTPLSTHSASAVTFTTADALTILKYSVGEEKLSLEQRANFDLNNDGMINTKDALFILRIAVGLEEEPPLNPNFPSPLIPLVPLTSEEKAKIIEDYVNYHYYGYDYISRTSIIAYYGIYNGYHIVEVKTILPEGHHSPGGGSSTDLIDGFHFKKGISQDVKLYKENASFYKGHPSINENYPFMALITAFHEELGLISRNDLHNIHYYYDPSFYDSELKS